MPEVAHLVRSGKRRSPPRRCPPAVRAKSLALLVLLGCSRAAPAPPSDGAPSATPSMLAPSASVPSTSLSATSAPGPSASAAPVAPSLPATAVTAIDEAASGAVTRGEVPGAVVAVVLRRGPEGPASLVFLKAYGVRRKVPSVRPMTADTVFDLASLTKAVATAPAVHVLVEEGKLSLEAPVARYLPSFARRGKDAITVAELLLHTGGLVADDALSDYQGTRAQIYARLDALELVTQPGTKFEYSDVGYIVLGELVEKVSGEPLDVFVKEHIFAPLGMADTSYNPSPRLAARAAPTEPRDDVMLEGKVHDPRAAGLGGVAGHAGVFSTASDLARFAVMLLGNGSAGATRILGPEAFARMVTPQDLPGGGRRSPGWDVQTGYSGARGELSGGYGHTGFTGTSLWVDPAAGVAVIVLSNRLHPDGKGDPRRLRREVATAVARALRSGDTPAPAPAADDAGAPPPPRPAGKVLTGIDVLERDGFSVLRGKRVGLVTNPSGVDAAGERTADVLFRAPGVTLAALFSPEHGLGGAADGNVGDSVDARTKLPVYSLYGKRTHPTAAQLAGLDALVFDLADAGARFFTFETTLGYVLESAAEHHLPLWVLDRPDPIGGVAVEGPVLDPSKTSFIAYHPLPIRHGLTLGELAGLFDKERNLGADLHVVRVEGWRRAGDLAAAGVRWVNPSPNLRSVDEALLYPGVALVEATNVSVGRGTPHPFEQVGAPWIDGARLAAALTDRHLPGVRFLATTFTPDTSTYSGERCQGVLLQVTDRAHVEPVRTGLSIAAALLRLHRERWEPKNLALLLGHPPTFAGLLRGDTPEALAAAWEPGLLAFRELRKRYLLYPEP